MEGRCAAATRSPHTYVAALAPQCDAAADVVDELVLLYAVLCPLGVEIKLLGSFFFGFAMGTKYELVRRPSTISFVMPSSVNPKWRIGSSKGELMIGFSITI